jgi:hypothetical protein
MTLAGRAWPRPQRRADGRADRNRGKNRRKETNTETSAAMSTARPDDMTVTLAADGTLRVHNLELAGASAEWAARAAADGGDVHEAVEEALDLDSRVPCTALRSGR